MEKQNSCNRPQHSWDKALVVVMMMNLSLSLGFLFSYGVFYYRECALVAESMYEFDQSLGRLVYFPIEDPGMRKKSHGKKAQVQSYGREDRYIHGYSCSLGLGFKPPKSLYYLLNLP